MADQPVLLDLDHFRVRPGVPVDLESVDPRDTPFVEQDQKDEVKDEILPALNDRLETLQELLWAQHRHRVLVVIQATDTGGKDSTIRRVFEGVDPSGVRVASFKKPTEVELAHDFLWRVHQQVPADGELVIFNRSHYEDVLVVRVDELVPESRWSGRYQHIVNFEQLLTDEGTTIVKLFLHISRDEQRERLQDRLDDPGKHWKFNPADLEPREKWNEYQQAFQDAINRTTTDTAPWFVVPADRKWYRDLVVSTILVETLERLNMTYPPAPPGLEDVTIPE
ncbi:MAG: polyphosphate kinase 2 family protein [Acidimicrobiales bacterium]